MKRIVFAFIALLPIVIIAAPPKDQALIKAENLIDEMFNDLKIISDKNEFSKASQKRLEFDKYFVDPDRDAPNEFQSLGFNNNIGFNFTTDISVRLYANQFHALFRDQNYADCSFRYRRRNSSIVQEPEFKKGEAPPRLVQIIMWKEYLRGGKLFKAFADTLVVGLEKEQVYKWANQTNRHHIGDSGGGVSLDIGQMKVDAALAYNKKQFDKAYHIYESIVNKYPQEGESYYRMAVMLYKKNYGSSLDKKERHKLILDYLDRAILYGNSSTMKCADNMRYWITC